MVECRRKKNPSLNKKKRNVKIRICKSTKGRQREHAQNPASLTYLTLSGSEKSSCLFGLSLSQAGIDPKELARHELGDQIFEALKRSYEQK